MPKTKSRVLIVGAGRAGTALIGLFREHPDVQIVGVVDADAQAEGLKLAKQNKIPTAVKWDDFLKNGKIDEVINVTGSEEVHQKLLAAKPAAVSIASGVNARILWYFAREYQEVERKIREAKEDIEATEWGLKKTNDAIKTLYRELEEKNKELQALDRLKSDFIATVSHELRTPLAITKEGIALIQDAVLGPVNERQAKVLTTAKDSIDRLARLIGSLLDISKIEAGRGDVNKSLIDVAKVARQVAEFFESKVTDKGLELRLNVPDRCVEAYADKDKIVQVFTNLVGNAVKFTEEGHIEVSVKEHEDEIECCVADTGRGVAKADIPKMFVKFQQINREHGDGERGTGLGLSIAKSIIEMHDGTIAAESDVGKGTKITFTLPKYADEVLFKEYVNKGLEEAKSHKTKMSLMVVTISNFEEAREKLPEEKLYTVLKGLERVTRDSLEHSGSVALKDSHECIVILPNNNKQGALSAEGRLKQAVDDYLAREKVADKIELKFSCATYPDDAQTGDELIKKVLKK